MLGLKYWQIKKYNLGLLYDLYYKNYSEKVVTDEFIGDLEYVSVFDGSRKY